MKHCITCEWSSKEPIQTNQGPMMGLICKHFECTDPVDASPLPCSISRKQEFCGLKGIFWRKKEEKEPTKILELVR